MRQGGAKIFLRTQKQSSSGHCYQVSTGALAREHKGGREGDAEKNNSIVTRVEMCTWKL